MDVLSLRATPFEPLAGESDEPRPTAATLRGLLERLRRLLTPDPGLPDGTGAISAQRRHLLAYTAAEITLGLGLLAVTTVTVPVFPFIDPRLDGTALAGPGGGVILWVLFGLLGSVRTVSSRGGEGHFTFHVPFVGAATVLGGPTAGAWVAMLSTIERRELESQPWYGILANHTATVIAAVCAGIVLTVVDSAALTLTGDAGLSRFVAVIVAASVLEIVATLLAAITILLRDQVTRSGLLLIVIRDFGRDTILEIALVWAFVMSYVAVGWWAPLVLGAGVLAFLASPGTADIDPLTGLVRQAGFDRRLGRMVGWMRRAILKGGTLMYLDLDLFKEVNDRYGHAVGNEVLVVVADRLRRVCPREEDIVGRLMGDEFALFFAGLAASDQALVKAEQVRASICQPIATTVGAMHVGVSVGVLVIEAWGGVPSPATLLGSSERAMYVAKGTGDPCGAVHLAHPDDPTPFVTD